MDVAVDLTESEMQAIKGKESKYGLCAYFPESEFFLQKREWIDSQNLPITVRNIEPNSPQASKKAHV